MKEIDGEIIETSLHCATCKAETVHQLRYAGRLLVSSICTVCQSEVKHERNDLRIQYAKDLQHRVATKPFRMWRRFWAAPRAVFWSFPKAVLSQPMKLWREVRNIER